MKLTEDEKLEIALTVEKHGILAGRNKLLSYMNWTPTIKGQILSVIQMYKEFGGKKSFKVLIKLLNIIFKTKTK